VINCREASGVDLTAPIINLRAWIPIISGLFKMVGIAVISVSQHYCRTGLHTYIYIFFIYLFMHAFILFCITS
jgi:hypothetical protein